MKDKTRKEKAFDLINQLYENQGIRFIDTIWILENGNTSSGFKISKSWNEEHFFLISKLNRKKMLNICFEYKIKELDILNLVKSFFLECVLFSAFLSEYEL